MKNKFSYGNLINRNWGYIDKPLQKKIRQARIVFAGCGLGSVIAESAVRIGFSNYLLADGDNVELSNLNRQTYNQSHLGHNKAVALASLMKKINPDIKVEVFKNFIRSEDLPSLVSDSSFIVSTVDISPVYFELVRAAQKNNCHIFLPFNAGFGSIVLIFNQQTLSLDELIQKELFKNEIEFFYILVQYLNLKKYTPRLTEKLLNIFSEVNRRKTFPQVRVGAEIASALVITSFLKILSGSRVPLAPDFLLMDLFSNDKSMSNSD